MYVNVYMYIHIYICIHYICDVDGKCWDMFAIKWLMIGNQCKLIRNIVIIVLPLLLLMKAIMKMQNMQIKPSLISLLCKPKKLWGRTSTCWFQKLKAVPWTMRAEVLNAQGITRGQSYPCENHTVPDHDTQISIWKGIFQSLLQKSLPMLVYLPYFQMVHFWRSFQVNQVSTLVPVSWVSILPQRLWLVFVSRPTVSSRTPWTPVTGCAFQPRDLIGLSRAPLGLKCQTQGCSTRSNKIGDTTLPWFHKNKGEFDINFFASRQLVCTSPGGRSWLSYCYTWPLEFCEAWDDSLEWNQWLIYLYRYSWPTHDISF